MNEYSASSVDDYNINKYDGYFFRNDDTNLGNIFSNLTDDLKLRIVLDSLLSTNQFEQLSDTNKNNYLLNEYINSYSVDIVKQITVSKVEEQYKLFFGTNVVEHKSFDVCFGYIYDKNTNMYFRIEPQCGGTSMTSIYNYKNKYVTKGDEAYVYVNYGIAEPDGDYTSMDDIRYKIYNSLSSNNIYKSNLTQSEKDSFTINESNYSDFEEYKYTFKKDDNGNYYFVSLEKTN